MYFYIHIHYNQSNCCMSNLNKKSNINHQANQITRVKKIKRGLIN